MPAYPCPLSLAVTLGIMYKMLQQIICLDFSGFDWKLIFQLQKSLLMSNLTTKTCNKRFSVAPCTSWGLPFSSNQDTKQYFRSKITSDVYSCKNKRFKRFFSLHFTSKPREPAVFTFNATHASVSMSFILARYAWDYAKDNTVNRFSWSLWFWLRIDPLASKITPDV